MIMAKKYRSEAYAAIHETMEALHEIGAIDKQTMREFDETCLMPALPMPPERIRALREREHLSQPIFALYLNVSKNLVSDWERGVKKPGGPALRLLTVVEKSGIQAIA
jgi:putative transcriptional regulator